MSNPLNDNKLKFKLNFKNEGSFGLIDTTEQVKFDGVGFVIEQENKRYGRDVSYMGDKVELFFYKGVYNLAENPQTLPDGTIINHLTQGFEYLIETIKIYGFESEVEYILVKDGITWVTGVLDIQGYETDGVTYIKCSIVQNTNKQTVKRNEDIVVDQFSNEDINGNPITPLLTTNILQKANPTVQKSEWTLPQEYNVGFPNAGATWFNFINNVTSFGIENTLSFIHGFNDFGDVSDFVYIIAANDLSNGTIELKDVEIDIHTPATSVTYIDFNVFYYIGENFDYNNRILLYNDYRDLTGLPHVDFSQFIINETLNSVIIPNGHSFWLWFSPEIPTAVGNINTMDFKNGSLNAEFTSTAIDSVIKGVRYVDVFKQTIKSISGLDVYAPKFDVGGKFYDQFAVTGNLIKQRDDLPFPVKFKDIISTLEEVNADYQILDDKVFIGHFEDFYPNKEIGVFSTNPDESFISNFNKRFTLNQLDFKYKTYEKDRDESNTIDSTHTESQWIVPNGQVENSKKISLLQIRDPFKIESTRNDALKETTSTSDDDKLFLIDAVELSPSATGNYPLPLTHNVNNDGYLQLLNNSTFKWGLLGFDDSAIFTLVDTSNSDTYDIIDITNNVITLEAQNIIPTSIGKLITTVSYPYTNVAWTNRTNEGFDVVNGVVSPNKYSNLKYTIKRNLQEWYSYLSTAFNFTDKPLKNTEFKNNGNLETKLISELVSIIENADVNKIDLGTPILTANLHNVTVVANFENTVNLLEAINTINDDDTIGGFVRVLDSDNKVIKGYIKKLEYEPSSEVLKLDLEERYESQNLIITTEGDEIIINEVGYPIEILESQLWEINNDYLIIFDTEHRPIINPIRYDFVTINNESFSNTTDLSNKLIEIS